ncbi:hypothetical protein GCM10011491_38550 [Brucella endophytica]|uniref:Uncharacterized protein n=1 Tax=Brucella endophytica TaxID=1963359 RepID=A0A916WJT1_9HYPH|nr:hypothetical protein GCM10011491_38550 [Brucella endophytica]
MEGRRQLAFPDGRRFKVPDALGLWVDLNEAELEKMPFEYCEPPHLRPQDGSATEAEPYLSLQLDLDMPELGDFCFRHSTCWPGAQPINRTVSADQRFPSGGALCRTLARV